MKITFSEKDIVYELVPAEKIIINLGQGQLTVKGSSNQKLPRLQKPILGSIRFDKFCILEIFDTNFKTWFLATK